MTPYEGASLAAQWVGSLAAVAAVLVAIVFGYLTLASNRRSRDAQQRAAITAAADSEGERQGLRTAARGPQLQVRLKSGETWLLINGGPAAAYDVRIEGLTDLDKRRLTAPTGSLDVLEPGQACEFALVSRLTFSGPANIRVTFRTETAGDERTVVLLVPAP